MASEQFIQGEWTGPGKDSAKTLITTHLRIRLTGPDKLPIKAGRCRMAAEPEEVYPCDGEGIAHIPWTDRSKTTLDLEWEGEGADSPFPWAGSVDVDIQSTRDEDLEKRLNHLSFGGANLAEKVKAYQEFLGLPITGLLEPASREDFAFWHDGGNFLGQAKDPSASKAGGGVPAPAAPAAPAEPEAGEPGWPRHVMIVPDEAAAKTDGVFMDNLKFAEQWVKYRPSERAMIKISATGELDEAVKQAAALAKKGPGKGGVTVTRKVILFVGHGAVRKPENEKSTTAFDTAPELGKMDVHKRTIPFSVLEFATSIRNGDLIVVDPNVDHPAFKTRSGVKMTDDDTGPWNGRQSVKWAKWLMLNRTAHILRDNGIEQFVLLSCSVGKDLKFANTLAKLMEVPVAMYKQKVATRQEGSNNLVKIWLTPGEDDTDVTVGEPALVFDAKDRAKEHPSLHEYPRPELQF